MSAPSRRGASAPRRGFTVVELLVVASVVALLLALILPAVQASRGAARKAACANNLKQVGVALHTFVAREGAYPRGGPLSPQGRLVADLGYPVAGDRLRRGEAAGAFGPPGAGPADLELPAAPPATLRCPADGQAGGGTNYSGNFGTGVRDHGFDGLFFFLDPRAHGAPEEMRPRDVRDGLGNTVAFAEVLRGAVGGGDVRREIALIPRGLAGEALAAACRDGVGRGPAVRWPGEPWLRGGVGTLYNHVLPPNAPSCLSGGSSADSAISTASDHPGGAQALFADGAVQFISDGVDPVLWRAFGSRDGGEIF